MDNKKGWARTKQVPEEFLNLYSEKKSYQVKISYNDVAPTTYYGLQKMDKDGYHTKVIKTSKVEEPSFICYNALRGGIIYNYQYHKLSSLNLEANGYWIIPVYFIQEGGRW